MFFEAGKKFLNPSGEPIDNRKNSLNLPSKRKGVVNLNKQTVSTAEKRNEEKKKKGCC